MEQTRYFKMEELRAVLEESAELEERVKDRTADRYAGGGAVLLKYSS